MVGMGKCSTRGTAVSDVTHHQSAAQGQWQCERQVWIDHTRLLGIVGPIVQLNVQNGVHM